MNIKKFIKIFNNFLYPQNSVVEIFLASFFLLLALCIASMRGTFPFGYFTISDFRIYLDLLIIISIFVLVVSTVNLFIKKRVTSKNLKLLQKTGTFIILPIGFFYSISVLRIVGDRIQDIGVLDYFILAYAWITIVRSLLVFFDFRSVKKLRRKNEERSARQSNFHPLFVIIILSVSLFVFFQDEEFLSLSLGRAYYSGIFIADLFSRVHSIKKLKVLMD